jgi:hypothetical protein
VTIQSERVIMMHESDIERLLGPDVRLLRVRAWERMDRQQKEVRIKTRLIMIGFGLLMAAILMAVWRPW